MYYRVTITSYYAAPTLRYTASLLPPNPCCDPEFTQEGLEGVRYWSELWIAILGENSVEVGYYKKALIQYEKGLAEQNENSNCKCNDGCTCGCIRQHVQTEAPGGDGTDTDDGYGGAGGVRAPTSDPMFLDLNRNGKLDAENRAYFDLNGNGFMENTNWMSDGDGLLVLDRNDNGIIENGTELFGDATKLKNGATAKTGFEALRDIDSNGDGIIDTSDEAFASLRVWIDANSNGISETGELKTLQELGVKAIHLIPQNSVGVDKDGNIVARLGIFEWEDGTTGLVGEMLLEADHMRNIPKEILEVPEEIVVMPELKGGGILHDLHQAMVRDESGRLKALLEDFMTETDETSRKKRKKVLYLTRILLTRNILRIECKLILQTSQESFRLCDKRVACLSQRRY